MTEFRTVTAPLKIVAWVDDPLGAWIMVDGLVAYRPRQWFVDRILACDP